MLITALEKEKKEIYQKGFEKGEARGIEKAEARAIEKGRMEVKIETVKSMLLEGFEVSVISRITGLSEDEILELKS